MLVHDLKNPLAAAIAGLSFVTSRPEGLDRLGAMEQKAIAIAIQSQTQLLAMIQDILDVSRAEADEMPLDLQRFDLSEVIVPVAEGMDARAKESGVELHLVIHGRLPARADPEKVRRVLVNLLDNAIRHTPRGGSVGILGEVAGEAVQVKVRDTGEGIPEELGERIFDKFVQSSAAKKGRKTSVGLGLAFCKLALEAHGGQIWVKANKPQKGTTFTFTLPLDTGGGAPRAVPT